MAINMKQTATQLLAVAALSSFSLLNAGCEQDSDRLMASAQSCMDSATTAEQANACAAKVEGIDTPAAYLIRCSANFIAQGFTGQRIADAYQGMTNSGSTTGSDPMLSMMSYLVFQEDNTNKNSISTTISNCTKSGTVSMQRLAEVANLASTVASVGGTDLQDFDPAFHSPSEIENAVKSAITVLEADTSKQAAIGTVIVQMNQSVCVAGSSLADKEVCDYAAAAIQNGSGNPQLIAQYLLTQLKGKF